MSDTISAADRVTGRRLIMSLLPAWAELQARLDWLAASTHRSPLWDERDEATAQLVAEVHSTVAELHAWADIPGAALYDLLVEAEEVE